MRNLGILLVGLGMGAAFGAVDITIGTCVAQDGNTTATGVNNNPDAWDMTGMNFTVAGSVLHADFPAVAGTLVPPKGTRSPYNVPCGGKSGAAYNKQLQSKIGSCNEPAPPDAPLPMTCNDGGMSVATLYQDKCIQDGLGINRGDGYGGFIDSYKDQTQIQVTLPAGTFTMGGKTVRFDPAASMGGPFYMMSMAALQEYLYVDMQFLMSLGASISGLGVVDASGTTLYRSPNNTGADTASYGSYMVTAATATKLAKDYPKYFPVPLNLEKLVATDGFGGTSANSPQQINSALLATMNLWWMFDGLKSAQDLCFKNFLSDAKDKSAGLKLMLGGYNIGPNVPPGDATNKDYATQILPTTDLAILNAADVTSKMKPFPYAGPDFNTQNYITRVFDVVNQLVAANKASKACGGALDIYDAPITLTQVHELFFGQGGTPALQGNGGLLWHFQIDKTAKAALLADLDCVFAKLQGQAPSTKGTANISFRYDFLTVLRVARQYFGGYVNKFSDRPTPADIYSSDYSIWVTNHSRNPCGRSTQDKVFPTMTLADSVYGKGAPLTGTFTDDKGIKEYAYSSDSLWRQWIPTTNNFTVPATLGDNDKLWFRIADSCGNAVIQQVMVKSLPPLDKVVATPPGGPFFGSVSVALDVPGVTGETIYYTTDGTAPTPSSAKYDPSKPIVITTDGTLKAIATAPGFALSPVETWTFTKQILPVTKAPIADPPGKTFTTLDPDFPVTLTPGESGSAILYTLNGTKPDTVAGGATVLYGGPITITTTTTITAIATKPGQIASATLVATYTETQAPKVATPVATPPGSAGTSPYRFLSGPLSVILTDATDGAAIQYRLDDGAPAAYSGPLAVGKTATLKAFAVKAGSVTSDTLTVQYLFTPPVSVSKAYYQDKDGDGKIETVIVEFEKDIPAAPDKLAFTIKDQTGQTEDRTATGGDIVFAAGSKVRLTVTLKTPFDYGITSVNNTTASGQLFKQDNIPLLDNVFPVDDSVPPVVFKAKVMEPDSANPMKRIFITLSEKPKAPLSGQSALIFKHDGIEAPSGQVTVKTIETAGDRDFVVYIDTGSAIYPIAGDFVALANDGQVRDGAGNAPSAKTFRILEGDPPKPKPTSIYVTFPNGKKDKASDGPEPQGDVVFIPMDAGGNALTGDPADGKCSGTCYTGDNGTFVGPVFHIVTPGPVTYEFQIFNNVGEFLAKGRGRFDAKDLQSMSKTNDASGVKYVARVVWTGRTTQGGKAGTGAYILQSLLTTDKDDRTGAPPSAEKKRVVFGLLRGFKGS